MSTRRTWLLGMVLALLAGYFVVFEGFAERRAVPDSDAGERLFDCARAQPKRITVATARGRISADRGDVAWQTSAGGLAPAAFEALAESLCRLPVIERIPGMANLGEFGLEPPAAEVDVVADTAERRLLLGTPTPASNLMYAKFADRPEVLKIGVEMASTVERVARFAAPGEGV